MLQAEGVRRPLVLVADDHEDTRAMLQALLTMHGYDVADYADGDTALAAAIRLVPDAVVLDGHLPGLDGFEVTRAIRECDGLRQPPIIFVSGWSGAEHEERARAAGCNRYMVKPIDLDSLVDVMRQLTAPRADQASP